MMSFKKIFAQLNILVICKKYNLPLWRCPQFLFLIMGGVIIITVLATYALATRYIADRNTVSLIIIVLTIILFIITFSITRTLEGLAEANRLKSEFINIVSHQLRSPLSNLKWVIDLLLSDRINRIEAKQFEYFKILKENSVRMEELVKDLLVAAKIETGEFPLKNMAFSLVELIENLISEIEPSIKKANTKIKFKVQPNLSNAFADPSQIRLVVENLLDNAIRYINPVRNNISQQPRENSIEIKLSQSKNNLYFEINDNGIGIPKQDQKHIFQKFFRSGNILQHQAGGSGLGLYLAKAVIEKSKGKIGFKSEEGKGSTFWFTLPIKPR